MGFYEVISENEIELATKIINKSFLTVALEFNFTQENAPTFPAYITAATIENQIQCGLKLFIYEDNGIGVGCIGVSYSNESNSFKAERLAVIPEYRHRGIGQKMMDFIEKKVKEECGSSVFVEIVNENIKLKEWYIRNNFSEVRIEKYDHLPFTVSVLEKKLI
jgi:N-acetylglutamate synthase-like GNAT family acetyltransferase